MMPFSVLRTWGLGFFSWVLLGAGLYCAYQAYEAFRMAREPIADVGRSDAIDSPETRDVRAADSDEVADGNEEAWMYLAGAIALLLVSFGGFLPVSLLLDNKPRPAPEPLSPSKTLNVERPDGSQLYVEVYGDDDRPTLLLTHGWSLDLSAWNDLKPLLAQKYRLVLWDLPGLGRSKGPTNRDFSIEKMAHDLDAVIRSTAVKTPLILVGHSIGGMIQQTFCRLHGEHCGTTVQGIVLLHTTHTNPLRTAFAASLLTALEAPLIVPLNYLTIALAPLAWLSNWQSYLNGSLHIATRFASFSGKQSRQQLDHAARLAAASWPGAVARGNLGMLKFGEDRTLPHLQPPVLVIGGEHDRMTLPSASDHIERLLPNDRPFRVDTGHLGHWEMPERIAEVIGEFVDQAVGGAKSTKSPAKSAVAQGHVAS